MIYLTYRDRIVDVPISRKISKDPQEFLHYEVRRELAMVTLRERIHNRIKFNSVFSYHPWEFLIIITSFVTNGL